MGNDLSTLHIHPGHKRRIEGAGHAKNESASFLDNLGGKDMPLTFAHFNSVFALHLH